MTRLARRYPSDCLGKVAALEGMAHAYQPQIADA